jgi:chromosome segregation ATPase
MTSVQEPNAIGGSMSQSSSINDLGSPIDMGMTREELEAARAEWQGELTQVEDEIQTLRQVLNAKTRRAHELKRKLGVTVWGEFTSDMGQGIKNVRESNAVQKMEETISTVTSAVTSAPLYQKTESAIKATAEKTTSLFGGIGSAMSQKLGALKNTESFRSMEERVSSAVSTVKVHTKMGGSRSGSVQSFDDALREATANQGGNPDGSRPNGTPTPVATPVVEEKPIS